MKLSPRTMVCLCVDRAEWQQQVWQRLCAAAVLLLLVSRCVMQCKLCSRFHFFTLCCVCLSHLTKTSLIRLRLDEFRPLTKALFRLLYHFNRSCHPLSPRRPSILALVRLSLITLSARVSRPARFA